ncbi:hypothetical protein JCM33374_g5866 [Metschnikowia sp. JCM 33374]|nr:hypothetical protein JCM33374_g5866 [Metschnikowia sp. JCM 33374]
MTKEAQPQPNDAWKKFKKSFSQLSLSGRMITDLTEMNVKAGRNSHESHTDGSFITDSDRDSTPIFSSTSTVDLNVSTLTDSDPISLAVMRQESSVDPPPRSVRRQSCNSIPPRKHPYPSNLTSTYRTYNTVANPLSLRKFLFGSICRKPRMKTAFASRNGGSSIPSATKSRGFKGISRKLRRCFSFPKLRRKPSEFVEVVVSEEPDSDSKSTVSEITSNEEESLYSRILRAAHDMDLDESTVGSLLMIVSEEPTSQAVC